MELLHFTGQIWRPPYESKSQLLQVTAGCTYDKCKFCSLYNGTKFRLSPLSEIEDDLRVITEYQPYARRVFLTGANPFALSFNKLFEIGLLIRKYLTHCENIGTFARISDIYRKTVDDLKKLRHIGFDNISIGTESGDNETLSYMKKGYTASDIIRQCRKLDMAGIKYNIVYLTGLAGKHKGRKNALKSAEVYNQLNPYILNIVMLTVFPESELYQDIQKGLFYEASEHEKLYELRTLIENLHIKTTILGNTVSNSIPIVGYLPKDKERMLLDIDLANTQLDEKELRHYRKSIKSL